jgi:hypothetical protein
VALLRAEAEALLLSATFRSGGGGVPLAPPLSLRRGDGLQRKQFCSGANAVRRVGRHVASGKSGRRRHSDRSFAGARACAALPPRAPGAAPPPA